MTAHNLISNHSNHATICAPLIEKAKPKQTESSRTGMYCTAHTPQVCALPSHPLSTRTSIAGQARPPLFVTAVHKGGRVHHDPGQDLHQPPDRRCPGSCMTLQELQVHARMVRTIRHERSCVSTLKGHLHLHPSLPPPSMQKHTGDCSAGSLRPAQDMPRPFAAIAANSPTIQPWTCEVARCG